MVRQELHEGLRELGGDRCEKRAWVQAKLLWNPARDVRALMRDFNAGVYGAAAPMMDEYDDLLENAGLAGHQVLEHYGRQEFMRQASILFDRAEAALASAGQTEFLPRLELARLPLVALQLDDLAAKVNAPSFDARRFGALLEFLRQVTIRERLRNHTERNPMSMYIDNYDIISQSRSGSGVVRFRPETMILYRDIGGRRVDDPLAFNGLAAVQEFNDTWSIQRDLPQASLPPGRRYQLRCHIRCDLPPGPQPAWLAGVYVKGKPEKSFARQFKASEVATSEYRWVEIGEPFLPQEASYFYCAGVANPANQGQFRCDAVELVPAQ